MNAGREKKGKNIENRHTANKRETESSTQSSSYPYSKLMKCELVKIFPVKPGS